MGFVFPLSLEFETGNMLAVFIISLVFSSFCLLLRISLFFSFFEAFFFFFPSPKVQRFPVLIWVEMLPRPFHSRHRFLKGVGFPCWTSFWIGPTLLVPKIPSLMDQCKKQSQSFSLCSLMQPLIGLVYSFGFHQLFSVSSVFKV